MHAASTGYDVLGNARVEIKRLKSSNVFATVRTTVFQALVSISPRHMIQTIARAIGAKLIRLLDEEAARRDAYTISFRGIAAALREDIQKSNAFPDAEFLNVVEELQQRQLKLIARFQRVASDLRDMNPNSRVAAAYLRLSAACANLYAEVYQLRLVAIGAEVSREITWEQEVLQARADFGLVVNKLDVTDSDDLDPEILALAERAVKMSDQRDFSNDPGWARRLAGSPYH